MPVGLPAVVRRMRHANQTAFICCCVHKATIFGEYEEDTMRLRIVMAIFTPFAILPLLGIWLGTFLLENPPNQAER